MTVGWAESIIGAIVILVFLNSLPFPHGADSNSAVSGWQDILYQWDKLDIEKFVHSWSGMLAGAVIFGSGQRFRWHARSHLSKTISAPQQGESFVLYLRSFQDDPKRAELEVRPRVRGAATPIFFLHELFSLGAARKSSSLRR